MLLEFIDIKSQRQTLVCDPNETIHDILPRIITIFQIKKNYIPVLLYKGKRLESNQQIKTIGYSPSHHILIVSQKQNSPTNTDPDCQASRDPQQPEIINPTDKRSNQSTNTADSPLPNMPKSHLQLSTKPSSNSTSIVTSQTVDCDTQVNTESSNESPNPKMPDKNMEINDDDQDNSSQDMEKENDLEADSLTSTHNLKEEFENQSDFDVFLEEEEEEEEHFEISEVTVDSSVSPHHISEQARATIMSNFEFFIQAAFDAFTQKNPELAAKIRNNPFPFLRILGIPLDCFPSLANYTDVGANADMLLRYAILKLEDFPLSDQYKIMELRRTGLNLDFIISIFEECDRDEEKTFRRMMISRYYHQDLY